MSDVTPVLYTVKDAATRTSLSEWEIRRLADAGILERRYIGSGRRFYRITAESIDRYIDSLPSEAVGA